MMGEATKMKYLTRFFVTVNPLFVEKTFSTRSVIISGPVFHLHILAKRWHHRP
jgi:hypothetical protein